MTAGISRAEQAAIDRIIRNTGGIVPAPAAGTESAPASRRDADEGILYGGGHAARPPAASSSGGNARHSGAGAAAPSHEPTAADDDGASAGGAGGVSSTVANINRIAQDNVNKLRDALRFSSQSNELADDTVTHLGRQRETIQRSLAASEATQGILGTTKRAIRDIKCGMLKERAVKTGIIGVLLLIIAIIVWYRWLRKEPVQVQQVLVPVPVPPPTTSTTTTTIFAPRM